MRVLQHLGQVLFLLIFFFGSAVFDSTTLYGYYDTPNDWNCVGKVSGQWKFGVAPFACDVAPLLEEKTVDADFSSLVYDKDRAIYMEQIVPLIKEAATYYLLKRKASATSEEIDGFVRAVLAMAHQESYISHYRRGGERKIKVMRGDFGHGHGLMQVDDRWHFVEVQSGRAWDIVYNIIYSLEEYYDGWERAQEETCVESETDYVGRARAAYSAYNGGPSKICRFTKANDSWARNDTGYFDKFSNQEWDEFVTGNEISQVDIKCYLNSGKARCDQPLNPSHIKHSLEFLETHSIFGVGSKVRLLKSINLRDIPGGALVGNALNGQLVEVLDYRYFDETSKRYYMIQYDGKTGYIYGGDDNSFNTWIELSEKSPQNYFIANSGDYIKIRNGNGVNLRDVNDKRVLDALEFGETVLVDSVICEKESNNIYYVVNLNGVVGRVYGGQVFPEITMDSWARVVSVESIRKYGKLRDRILWRVLKKCPESGCQYLNQIIFKKASSNATEAEFEILEELEFMVKVKSLSTGAVGWLYKKDIVSMSLK